MIKLIRIDDRLLHGQVALTWTPSLGVDSIIIANDRVAADEFQKMTLGLAKPAGTKLFIKTIVETSAFLRDEKNKNLKILVLVNSVKDAVTLAGEVSEINAVNFGGLRQREGAKQITKAIALTAEDITLIQQLLSNGIELEVRQVPSDKKQMMQDLI